MTFRNRILLLAAGTLIIAGCGVNNNNNNIAAPATTEQPVVISKNMQLTSPAFVNNEKIPAKYTCDGENIAPELNVSGVPVEAESLALIVDDPDAPMGALRPGSGQAWDHWLVYNISPLSASIAENSVPEGGIQVTNSFGRKTYGGPCPPSGVHHYRFKLYALDAKLELGISSKKGLEEAMKNHLLAQTELVGLYAR